MLNSNIWPEILADLKKCKILIHPFAASCFLRTLSLKWSRKMMIELLAKNNNSDSVTNKKCPKLMSERGFSEIIFFSRCTTSWSLNSFLGLQFKVSKTSLTWLQNSMGNIQSSWPSSLTRRFAFCVLLMMNYRISWLLWRGAKAASRLLSNAHHAISTKIASQQHQLFKQCIFSWYK